MSNLVPTIEFFSGVPEVVDNVSLRQDQRSGCKVIQLTFRELRSLEQFNSFTRQFNKTLRLNDAEGEITVEPSSVRFIFGGPEGDTFERMECQFEVNRDDHWDRFMRFMNRYAAANGMAYGDTQS